MEKACRELLLIRCILALIILGITSCTGPVLSPAYIKTDRFLEEYPVRKKTHVFQVDVKPFENQLKERSKVGIKRVGVNRISGPLLPTQDPIAVTQKGVISQLRQKGIKAGRSHLQLQGIVHDFFVDVDVDPASGRGKFSAIVMLDLAIQDTKHQQQIWQETYTGKATASAPSVVDRVYERALKAALSSLMAQIQQDDSILDARHASNILLAAASSKPPRQSPDVPAPKRPSAPSLPSDTPNTASTSPKQPKAPPPTPQPSPSAAAHPPQVAILMPALEAGKTEITTQATTLPIIGLVVGTNAITKIKVTGADAQMTQASQQELSQAGLKGPGTKFTGYAFLTTGVNRIKVQAEDRSGQTVEKLLTIRKQVVIDNTAPHVVLLEPPLTRAIAVVSAKPMQRFVGFASDNLSGVAEVRINDDSAVITPASQTALEQVGLSGKGIHFVGETELEKGQYQVVVKAIDRWGNERDQRVTIQRRQ